MAHPLVSIICLCYNHERFIREAIESVMTQTYPNLEIILVDDASTDGSRDVIADLIKQYKSINYIPLKQNSGICKAFNVGFAHSSGEFVVDFATDDVFHPERIARQVERFLQLDANYGVIFTDAVYIDELGRRGRRHFQYLQSKGLIDSIPQGDVYKALLQRYFVASPTMMVRREVMEKLQGYDESLSYEDFDFWIRSSRFYKYSFLDEALTMIRRSSGSLSTGWYVPGDPQLHSTYLVCQKAKQMNQNQGENEALAYRLRYEIRQSVFSDNKNEAQLFYELLATLEAPGPGYQFLMIASRIGLPLGWVRKLYHRLRFG